MKAFVVCALLGLASAGSGLHHPKWAAYKAEHGKQYDGVTEAQRAAIFAETDAYIKAHNERYARGEVSYSLGHNMLSDMTQEEVKQKYLGKKPMSLEGMNITMLPASTLLSRPASVDYRDSYYTPAKDQAGCGSCYAFGSMGPIEYAWAKKNGGRKSILSEQQIVDCSYRIDGGMNGGCGGGHEVTVMNYVSQNGLVLESQYPYTSGRSGTHGRCQQNGGPHAKGLKFRGVAAGNEGAFADALATYGPLVASISGENRNFQMHGGGIFNLASCPKNVDHVVSIFGYGTENGMDYWLVKNSWGRSWGGMDGVGKVRRGVNMCGIANDKVWTISF